jgi:hypothetical protein
LKPNQQLSVSFFIYNNNLKTMDDIDKIDNQLAPLSKELHEFSIKLVNGRHQVDITTDDFVFLAFFFTSKQIGHFESVFLLMNQGNFLDAGIIVRTMIEGSFRLSWVAESPQERAFLWKYYGTIEDFFLLKERERNGENISIEQKKDVIEKFERYAHHFLTEKGLKQYSEQGRLPEKKNLYDTDWTKGQISKLIGVDKSHHFTRFYSITSKWLHWNPVGIALAFERIENRLKYRENPEDIRLHLYLQSYLTLYESIRIFCQAKNINADEKLFYFGNEFKKIFD